MDWVPIQFGFRHTYITENLKSISDLRIRKLVPKGPKYRVRNHIDFNKCREEKASALIDSSNR